MFESQLISMFFVFSSLSTVVSFSKTAITNQRIRIRPTHIEYRRNNNVCGGGIYSHEISLKDFDDEERGKKNRLDNILSKSTSAFPLFVLSSAILGMIKPESLAWIAGSSTKSGSPLITLMLACVMIAMGMTLEKRDFREVFDDRKSSVPIGVLCQFMIMPLLALAVGRKSLLSIDSILGPSLFFGFVLVGCVPGGTASNLVSLIAGADVALSVVLTSASTLLASFVTPLLVKKIIGTTVVVSSRKLFEATAKVVFLPILGGMILNAKAPNFSKKVSRFTPFASVLLVSILCGAVVAQNTQTLLSLGSTSILYPLLLSIFNLHSLGFLLGYCIPRFIFRYPIKSCRTLSIEVGMQNSALAVVLARSVSSDPLSSLPGALSATAHSCLGSMLAAFWRFQDQRKLK